MNRMTGGQVDRWRRIASAQPRLLLALFRPLTGAEGRTAARRGRPAVPARVRAPRVGSGRQDGEGAQVASLWVEGDPRPTWAECLASALRLRGRRSRRVRKTSDCRTMDLIA